MEAITNITQLNARIIELEIKQMNERALIKAQFQIINEELKPVNLIKSAINDIVKTPHYKGDIVNTILSYATGYLAKKAVTGSTHNPVKQILGVILQTGVTNAVSNNAGDIKSLVLRVFKNKIQKILS